MNNCFFCNAELVWESDFMMYEIYRCENEEEECKNEYKKFWFPEE